MIRTTCKSCGTCLVLCCRSKYINIHVIVCCLWFVECCIRDVHENISLFFLCFYKCVDCCIQMTGCFINCCLCMWSFYFIFCFLKLCLHCRPAVCCIIWFRQTFGFLNCCFQICCTDLFFCIFYDVFIFCLEIICYIFITQCWNCNCPVSRSICSFRQCTTQWLGKSKLNSHWFMHPVICCKFCSVCCFCIRVCTVISIVCPFYTLHICSEGSVITRQIYS